MGERVECDSAGGGEPSVKRWGRDDVRTAAIDIELCDVGGPADTESTESAKPAIYRRELCESVREGSDGDRSDARGAAGWDGDCGDAMGKSGGQGSQRIFCFVWVCF